VIGGSQLIESHVYRTRLHQSIRIIDTDQPFLVIHVEDELPSIRVRKRDAGGCQVICSNGPLLELRVDIFPGLNSVTKAPSGSFGPAPPHR